MGQHLSHANVSFLKYSSLDLDMVVALLGLFLITWVSARISFLRENFPDISGSGGPGPEILRIPLPSFILATSFITV